MRKITFLLLFSIIFSGLMAQEKQEFKNILVISPFQIVNGIRIKNANGLLEVRASLYFSSFIRVRVIS